MVIFNKKARFNFEVEEEYEAGLVLLASEVKSVRAAKVSINEAYISEIKGELFLTNANISSHKGSRDNHEPTRNRKLLLHKKQVNKILGKIGNQGYSAFPIKLFQNSKGFFKLTIGIGKGKKLYDKRETIKARDESRRMRREES